MKQPYNAACKLEVVKDPISVINCVLGVEATHESTVIEKSLYNCNLQIAGSWLKGKDLPKIGRFTTVDKRFLHEAKTTLSEYLSVSIIKDDLY